MLLRTSLLRQPLPNRSLPAVVNRPLFSRRRIAVVVAVVAGKAAVSGLPEPVPKLVEKAERKLRPEAAVEMRTGSRLWVAAVRIASSLLRELPPVLSARPGADLAIPPAHGRERMLKFPPPDAAAASTLHPSTVRDVDLVGDGLSSRLSEPRHSAVPRWAGRKAGQRDHRRPIAFQWKTDSEVIVTERIAATGFRGLSVGAYATSSRRREFALTIGEA